MRQVISARFPDGETARRALEAIQDSEETIVVLYGDAWEEHFGGVPGEAVVTVQSDDHEVIERARMILLAHGGTDLRRGVTESRRRSA